MSGPFVSLLQSLRSARRGPVGRALFGTALLLALGASGPDAPRAEESDAAPAPRRLVMIAGAPSHGPGEHEFNAGVRLLSARLAGFPGLEVSTVFNGWPADESVLDGADAIFLYMDGGSGHAALQGERIETLRALMAKGVSLGCAHFAVEVPKDRGGKEWLDWIGGYYEDRFSCNPMWKPEFTTLPDHPISRGVGPFAVRDEWYFNMRFPTPPDGVTRILVARPSDEVRDGPYVWPKGPYPHIQAEKGREEAMLWCIERPDGGRGFGFTGGHFHSNWGDAGFRKVVLNALVWLSKLEVPEGGVESEVTEQQLKEGLDPKGKK